MMRLHVASLIFLLASSMIFSVEAGETHPHHSEETKEHHSAETTTPSGDDSGGTESKDLKEKKSHLRLCSNRHDCPTGDYRIEKAHQSHSKL